MIVQGMPCRLSVQLQLRANNTDLWCKLHCLCCIGWFRLLASCHPAWGSALGSAASRWHALQLNGLKCRAQHCHTPERFVEWLSRSKICMRNMICVGNQYFTCQHQSFVSCTFQVDHSRQPSCQGWFFPQCGIMCKPNPFPCKGLCVPHMRLCVELAQEGSEAQFRGQQLTREASSLRPRLQFSRELLTRFIQVTTL